VPLPREEDEGVRAQERLEGVLAEWVERLGWREKELPCPLGMAAREQISETR
jgi:hypothetical protein